MANPTGKGGFQERKHQINRKGRPRTFDALRELALQIAHETGTKDNGEPLIVKDHIATVAELILRQWAASKRPELQRAFIEIAYGKVPDELKATTGDVKIRVLYGPDSQAATAAPETSGIPAEQG